MSNELLSNKPRIEMQSNLKWNVPYQNWLRIEEIHMENTQFTNDGQILKNVVINFRVLIWFDEVKIQSIFLFFSPILLDAGVRQIISFSDLLTEK